MNVFFGPCLLLDSLTVESLGQSYREVKRYCMGFALQFHGKKKVGKDTWCSIIRIDKCFFATKTLCKSIFLKWCDNLLVEILGITLYCAMDVRPQEKRDIAVAWSSTWIIYFPDFYFHKY